MTPGQPPSTVPPSSARPGGGGPPRPSGPAPSSAMSAPVLDPMRLIMTYWMWGVIAAIVGIVLGFVVYFALLKLAPSFVSSAIFEADAPKEIVGAGDQSTIGTGGSDELDIYMETQVQNMVSDRLLRQAINEPNIRETKWIQNFIVNGRVDEVEALKDLRDHVSARVVPDTLFMQLNARFSSRTDAKTVADVLQTVYMADIRRQSNRGLNDDISLLENTLRVTRQEVEALDRRIDNLLGENQVTSLEQRETGQFAEIQNLQPALVAIREQRALAREQLSSYEQLLNSPGGVQYPDTVRSEAETHPIIANQDALIANEKAAIRAMLNRFGERHREVLRRKNLLSALEQERAGLVEQKTAELFRARIEQLRSTIANLQESENDLQERLRQAQDALVEITQVLKGHDNLAQDRYEKQESIKSLNERISNLRMLVSGGTRVALNSAPEVPNEVSFPRIPVTVGGTAFLVCAAVGGLILLKEIRETRVRGPQDILAIPRTKVLGVIPDISLDPSNPESVEMASRDKPQGVIAESFRQIRGGIIKCMDEHDISSIVVCAGMPSSGATSVTTNLALKLSVAGHRILVVDGNLRRPSMHKVFGVSRAPGLGDCLLGKSTLDACTVSTSFGNIDLLPAGETMDGIFEKLPTKAMADIMAQAEAKYDLVLVDSAPGMVGEDAVSIANHCDACILVARALSEKRGLVARLRNQLSDTSAQFLGVIVNGVESSAGGYFKKNYKTTHDYTTNDRIDKDKSGKGKKSTVEESEKAEAGA